MCVARPIWGKLQSISKERCFKMDTLGWAIHKNTEICMTRKRTWIQNHTEKCICVAKTASRQRQSNSPDLWEQRCCGQVNRLVSWQGGWASVAKSNLPIIPINWLIYSNQLYLEEEFIHCSSSAPVEQHSQSTFKSSHRSERICGLQKN